MSSAALVDLRLRRWTARSARPIRPRTLRGLLATGRAAYDRRRDHERGGGGNRARRRHAGSAGYADGPAMALGLGATDESLISVIAGTWSLNQLATRTPVTDGSVSAVIAGPRAGEFVLTDGSPTSASAFEWFVDSVLRRAVGDQSTKKRRCSTSATGKSRQDASQEATSPISFPI